RSESIEVLAPTSRRIRKPPDATRMNTIAIAPARVSGQVYQPTAARWSTQKEGGYGILRSTELATRRKFLSTAKDMKKPIAPTRIGHARRKPAMPGVSHRLPAPDTMSVSNC